MTVCCKFFRVQYRLCRLDSKHRLGTVFAGFGGYKKVSTHSSCDGGALLHTRARAKLDHPPVGYGDGGITNYTTYGGVTELSIPLTPDAIVSHGDEESSRKQTYNTHKK